MRTKASLLGRGLHLGNVTMCMRVVEVMLWRDSMVRYCDELFRGCVPGYIDVSAEERLRGKRDLS